MFLQLSLDISRLPDWAIPAIGGGIALVVLMLGYLIFGKKSEPARPAWQEGPMMRTFQRQQIQRANEAPRGADQRTSLRRTGNPVDIHLTDAEARQSPRTALVLDRSMRGLCVAVDEPHPVGAIINVRPTRSGNAPWVKVRIKNCRGVAHGYELGCEFVTVPSSDVLMMFG